MKNHECPPVTHHIRSCYEQDSCVRANNTSPTSSLGDGGWTSPCYCHLPSTLPPLPTTISDLPYHRLLSCPYSPSQTAGAQARAELLWVPSLTCQGSWTHAPSLRAGAYGGGEQIPILCYLCWPTGKPSFARAILGGGEEGCTWEILGSRSWEHRKQSKGRDAQWLLHCLVHHCWHSKHSTDTIRPSRLRAAVLFREGSGLCWDRAQSQGSFSSTAESASTCSRSSLYCR